MDTLKYKVTRLLLETLAAAPGSPPQRQVILQTEDVGRERLTENCTAGSGFREVTIQNGVGLGRDTAAMEPTALYG